jgi:ATP-dependent DNA helicase RecG
MSSSAGKNRKSNDAEWPPLAGIAELPGIGPGRQKVLESLGIRSVIDLLLYIPRRYIDRKATVRVSDLTHGEIQTVAGEVVCVEVKRSGRKTLTLARVRDASGTVTCVWFNQPYLKNSLRRGRRYVLSGQVRRDRFGTALVHPEYEIAGEKQLHTGRMVPVYRLARGFGQRRMRRLADAALVRFADGVADPAPLELRRRLGLASLGEALWGLHYPDDLEHAARVRRRLAFDEMLLFQILFARARAEGCEAARRNARARGTGEAGAAPRSPRRKALGPYDLLASLPFDLTSSQKAVLGEVLADLESSLPMRRLIQGDVGCGKTVIASLGAVWVCGAGGQVALMCPTELLAEQHYGTMKTSLGKFGHSVALLVGGLPPRRQDAVLADLALGRVDMVVGTHSLFSERVDFGALRLVIIDEEQRFGVLQRAGLLAKAPEADLLAISATPIPRTLALTAYGDLDISVIDEMPPGRGRHTTRLVPEEESRAALREVASRMLAGEQAFYICPALEEGSLGLKDVEMARREVERLLEDGEHTQAGPGGRGRGGSRRVGVLTGRTGTAERQATIGAFEAGDLACIVATSVLEVGIDVPRATLLVVEQAHRFGLSQLHQMRGRVQRSSRDSHSYLIVPDSASGQAIERLKVLEGNYDGFDIAEQDLMLRGPGDIVGRRQHGVPDLRFTSLPEDLDLLHAAREEAFRMVGSGGDAAYEAWLEVLGRAASGDRAIIQ